MHLRAFVEGAALGAAAAYLFDPDSGDGRRARLRDQAEALVRQGRERADGLSRHAGNVIEGKLHELGGAADLDRTMDDATVADRIRSEVLGRGDLEADGVVVIVENGKAQLRGAAPTTETIEDIVDRTRAVAGVLDGEPDPLARCARPQQAGGTLDGSANLVLLTGRRRRKRTAT